MRHTDNPKLKKRASSKGHALVYLGIIFILSIVPTLSTAQTPISQPSEKEVAQYLAKATDGERNLIGDISSICREALYTPSVQASTTCNGRIRGWRDRFPPQSQIAERIGDQFKLIGLNIEVARVAEGNSNLLLQHPDVVVAGVDAKGELDKAKESRIAAHAVLDTIDAAIKLAKPALRH